MEGYIAEIRGFAGNFAPRNWAYCQGQLLSINSNQALFSLIGTIYGGDGRTTFALPDLRGRAPLSSGTGPGLSPRPLGQRSGTETVTLNTLQIPSHDHVVYPRHADTPNTDNPTNAYPANVGQPVYGTVPSGNMGAAAVGMTGGSQYHNNMQPYLVINWVICLTGVFPSRS